MIIAKTKEHWEEIVGWYGMSALILAYALTSFNVVSPQGYVFQLLNLTGAMGLMAIAYKKRVFQSVFLNVFWIAIGAIAITRLLA